MTQEACIRVCKSRGYSFAGLQNKQNCHCGDDNDANMDGPSNGCKANCLDHGTGPGVCYGVATPTCKQCGNQNSGVAHYFIYRTSTSVTCPSAGLVDVAVTKGGFLPNALTTSHIGVDIGTGSIATGGTYEVDLGFTTRVTQVIPMSGHSCGPAGSGCVWAVVGSKVQLFDSSRNLLGESLVDGMDGSLNYATAFPTYFNGVDTVGVRYIRLFKESGANVRFTEIYVYGSAHNNSPRTIGSPPSEYIGCFKDNADRVMDLVLRGVLRDGEMQNFCLSTCAEIGYPYAGRAGTQCYCGNQYNTLGQSSDCGVCINSIDPSNPCGTVGSSIAVYSTTAGGGSVAALESGLDCGCLKGTLFTHEAPTYLTQEGCIQICKSRGYNYAAMNNVAQCRCGNDATMDGPGGNCNKRCINHGTGPGVCYGGSDTCTQCGYQIGNNRGIVVFRTSTSVSCPIANLVNTDLTTGKFLPDTINNLGVDTKFGSYAIGAQLSTTEDAAIYEADLGYTAAKVTTVTPHSRYGCGSACKSSLLGCTVQIFDSARNLLGESVITGEMGASSSATPYPQEFTASGVRYVRVRKDEGTAQLMFSEVTVQGVAHE